MENPILQSISKEITEWEQSPYIEIEYYTNINYQDIGRRIQFSKYPLKHKDYQMRENLDRIKLPCYCTFEWRGKRRLGLITYDELRDDSDDVGGIYSLHEIDKQTHQKVGSVIDFETDIEELIEDYKINIGKVKLTYYETI